MPERPERHTRIPVYLNYDQTMVVGTAKIIEDGLVEVTIRDEDAKKLRIFTERNQVLGLSLGFSHRTAYPSDFRIITQEGESNA